MVRIWRCGLRRAIHTERTKKKESDEERRGRDLPSMALTLSEALAVAMVGLMILQIIIDLCRGR